MIHELYSGLILGFSLTWQPKLVCIKARGLLLLSSVPEAESLASGGIGLDKVMIFLYHKNFCVDGVVLVTLYVQLCKFGLTGPFIQLFLKIRVT